MLLLKFKVKVQSINTEIATGRFTFNIFASLAEFERENLSWIISSQSKRKNGE
jgi:DNA invertase Pin-like site-specific DNA recombinase